MSRNSEAAGGQKITPIGGGLCVVTLVDYRPTELNDKYVAFGASAVVLPSAYSVYEQRPLASGPFAMWVRYIKAFTSRRIFS